MIIVNKRGDDLLRTSLVALVVLLARLASARQDWCVPGCSCFEEELGARIADCSRRHLLNVDAEMLGNEIRVQALDLSHNLLSELPADFPDNIKGRWRLIALSLSNNAISSVSPQALRGLTSLRALDLSDNRIATLPRDFLHSVPTLRALSLDGNRLHPEHGLDGGSLLDAPNLTRLSLARCNLGHLSSQVLSELPSLQILDLSGNQLTKLPADFPSSLSRLEIIDNPPILCSDPAMQTLLSKLQKVHSDCIIPQDPNQPKRSEAIISQDHGMPAVFSGLSCDPVAESTGYDTDISGEFNIESHRESVFVPGDVRVINPECPQRKPGWLHMWNMPAFWTACAGFLLGIFVSVWTVWCCNQINCCTTSCTCCDCCCRRREDDRRRDASFSRGAQSDSALLLGDSTPSLFVEEVNAPPGTPPPPYRNLENNSLIVI